MRFHSMNSVCLKTPAIHCITILQSKPNFFLVEFAAYSSVYRAILSTRIRALRDQSNLSLNSNTKILELGYARIEKLYI